MHAAPARGWPLCAPSLILAACLALPAAAGADEAPDGQPAAAPPVHYESVIVGKRLPEDPFRSDRSITVVTRRELAERPPRTTPEALWDSPGVFVQQTNHGGGSPILRGLIGPQNLILVDGVRLNNSVYRTGPLQYLNLIDPYSIERIEVLRGPGSVLYGSDAMGGVIQVSPLSAADYRAAAGPGARGQARLRYASANDGAVAHLHLDTGYRGFSMLGGATFKSLQNLTAGRGVGEQVHSGYDNWSVLGGAIYRFTDGPLAGWSWKTGYLMARIDDAGRTDKLFDRRSLQLYDNEDQLVYSRLQGRLPCIHTTGDVTLSYQYFFERKDNISLGADLSSRVRTVRDEVTAETLGLDLQLSTRVLGDRLELQYGGMLYHDTVDADQLTRPGVGRWRIEPGRGPYQDGSTYANYGAFLLAESTVLRHVEGHVLRAAAGYRFHGMAGSAPAQGERAAVDFDHQGHVVMASVRYHYLDQVTAALNYSQGFRAPNLAEAVQLGDTGKFFHIPNPGLKPERSDTIELLARARHWRLTGGVSLWVSLLDDLVKRTQTTYQGQTAVGGKDVVWNVNGERGLLWGAEARAELRIAPRLTLAGHITYTWGEENVPGGDDVPLSRVPPLFGQLSLRYDTPRLGPVQGYVLLYMRAAAGQDRLSPEDEKDARIPGGGTPGWASVNLALGLTAWRRLRLGLAVENVLDKAYKYHGSGVYAPGTNAVLSLSAAL